MKVFNCLIVDDEPIAREIIQNYCSHFPNLNVVASCDNALDAKDIIGKSKIDILFLDINMPVLDGIAFLKTLKNRPQVIFTTAYKEFATDAFDLAACDYLLKPFSLDRFMVAIDKAMEKHTDPIVVKEKKHEVEKDDFIFIKSGGKIFKIQHKDLLFAEASGNYVKIYTTRKTLTAASTFSDFEKLLPKSQFIRVHRSFIVNKSKIDHIEGNRIFIENFKIPVGKIYRDNFLKKIGISS